MTAIAPRVLASGDAPPFIAYEFVDGPLLSELMTTIATSPGPLDRGRHHRSERDSHEVERHGQRQRVEVAD